MYFSKCMRWKNMNSYNALPKNLIDLSVREEGKLSAGIFIASIMFPSVMWYSYR